MGIFSEITVVALNYMRCAVIIRADVCMECQIRAESQDWKEQRTRRRDLQGANHLGVC